MAARGGGEQADKRQVRDAAGTDCDTVARGLRYEREATGGGACLTNGRRGRLPHYALLLHATFFAEETDVEAVGVVEAVLLAGFHEEHLTRI